MKTFCFISNETTAAATKTAQHSMLGRGLIPCSMPSLGLRPVVGQRFDGHLQALASLLGPAYHQPGGHTLTYGLNILLCEDQSHNDKLTVLLRLRAQLKI
ncbi:hypothetical protein RRG08_020548 [Elysia crispata]|uniref:Uncharacterized protein n=1 Tax=Elysia crispata TaxID=231223 RepID=A0AAE1A7D6_9GAST|nr:hypothetical protein RRG08_020548 [Elysia crispata]